MNFAEINRLIYQARHRVEMRTGKHITHVFLGRDEWDVFYAELNRYVGVFVSEESLRRDDRSFEWSGMLICEVNVKSMIQVAYNTEQ